MAAGNDSRLVFSILFFALLPILTLSTPAQAGGVLPDTGQMKCYDNAGEIPCPTPGEPFYGQDANYLGPQMAYEVSADGLVVTDFNTGLMWQQVDDGVERVWADALSYCEDLVLGDYEDWRLPSRLELVSIVDYGRYDPSIHPVFSSHSRWHWTANTCVEDSGDAWAVDFEGGSAEDNGKDSLARVRCVRGGSSSRTYVDNGDGTVTDTATGLMWQQADDGLDKNWQEALFYCETLDFAGKTDWRLPDIRELQSIVDETLYNPAINPIFNCLGGAYWSASSHVYSPDSSPEEAWHVFIRVGNSISNSKTHSFFWRALCVRGGPSFAGDIDHDQDSDGKDLSMLISNFPTFLDERILSTFAGAFGRLDLP